MLQQQLHGPFELSDQEIRFDFLRDRVQRNIYRAGTSTGTF